MAVAIATNRFQGVVGLVRDGLVLPLFADRAFRVIEVAVEGQVFRPAQLTDAFAGDENF